jgi:curved DNA-binding protein CbpA
LRTHYDNLEIAENAPDKLARAAYLELSQRFHPDKNPENPDAIRIMQIINDAYVTLSNPVHRRQYDEYIARAREAEASTCDHYTLAFSGTKVETLPPL